MGLSDPEIPSRTWQARPQLSATSEAGDGERERERRIWNGQARGKAAKRFSERRDAISERNQKCMQGLRGSAKASESSGNNNKAHNLSNLDDWAP